jgi:hypothetical protein
MKSSQLSSVLLLSLSALVPAASILADDSPARVRAVLVGLQEVPSVSTTGIGRFDAAIDAASSTITYRLRYDALEAPILQSHIHFGQFSVNGGISVFLCSNLGNGPAGTQTCPEGPAEITGTIVAADVLGPEAQGIAPGELAELLTAVRRGAAYVNIHTSAFPGGEIRGQLVRGQGR